MGFGGWIGQASQAGPASSPQWTTTHRFVDQDQMGGDDGDQCGAHTFPQQGCNNKFISMIDGRQEFQKYLRVVQNVVMFSRTIIQNVLMFSRTISSSNIQSKQEF